MIRLNTIWYEVEQHCVDHAVVSDACQHASMREEATLNTNINNNNNNSDNF